MAIGRKTAISWVEPGKITIRGKRVDELIGNLSFAGAVYMVLCGHAPTPECEKMFEAILVSVIDHGVRPPSTIAAVTVANTGADLNASVAAGILAINKYHGGAIEDCMIVLEEAIRSQSEQRVSPPDAAANLAAQYRQSKKRVSGFGHRHHEADPRTARLFEIAAECGLSGKYVEQAMAFEAELSKLVGKHLPINADGAIAALLCEMKFDAAVANGIFMIARVPGLVAHAVEERERNSPMLTVDVNSYEYDGLLEGN